MQISHEGRKKYCVVKRSCGGVEGRQFKCLEQVDQSNFGRVAEISGCGVGPEIFGYS